MKYIPVLISILLITLTLQAADPQVDYAPLMEQLDAGGESFAVINGAYAWKKIQPSFDFSQQILLQRFKDILRGPDNPNIQAHLHELPQRVGLTEILCLGQSTRRQENGAYHSKYIIQKDPTATGWMWQLMGQQQDLKDVVRLLPDQTVHLMHGSLNAPFIYETFRQEISILPELASFMAEVEEEVTDNQFPLEPLLQSMEQGLSFAITFNPQEKWTLSFRDFDYETPEMGFVFRFSDPKGEISSYLIKGLEQYAPPLPTEVIAGISVKTKSIELPFSTQVSYKIVTLDGITLIASSTPLMQELIERQRTPQASPLEHLLQTLPDTRMQVASLSHPDFKKFVIDFKQTYTEQSKKNSRRRMYDMVIENGDNVIELLDVVMLKSDDQNINLFLQHQQPLQVKVYTLTGFMTPIIIIWNRVTRILPEVLISREDRNRKTCMNHLRLISAASDQWAIENNMPGNVVPEEEHIVPYMREGKMPTCPEGGVYELNTLNESPVCSIHGKF
ncbi:hypothetical protein P3T73_03165 [Kiritimatiellota bacterium B12222]|nr:hypothetical protein P3T73_03165 [Kiritimatiellota bacterium B12222]